MYVRKLWRPRLVVTACALSTITTFKQVTGRQVPPQRTGEVRLMGLLPVILACRLFRRNFICRVMHPAMPVRRNFAWLHNAVIHHPAALSPHLRVNLPPFVIAVAKSILANVLAMKPCINSSTNCRHIIVNNAAKPRRQHSTRALPS